MSGVRRVAVCLVALAACVHDEAKAPAGQEQRAAPSEPRLTPAPVAAPDASTVIDAAPEVGGFPALDVEVVHADGAPAAGTGVYALLAGEPGGLRQIGYGPFAFTDPAGRCRLVLPKFGTFDVGASTKTNHAMTTDVVVPHRGTIRLMLPPTAEVTFVLAPDARPAAWGVEANLSSRPLGKQERAVGRGETFFWSASLDFHESRTIKMRLPIGTPLAVEARPDYAASPTSLSAPGVVRFEGTGRQFATLRFRLAASEFVERAEGWVLVEVDADDPYAPPVKPWAVRLRDGRATPADRGGFDWDRVFWTRSSTVRWHGRGIVAGECRLSPGWNCGPYGEAVLTLDGTPLPTELPPDSGVFLPREVRIDVRPTALAASFAHSSEPIRVFAYDDSNHCAKADVGTDGVGLVECRLPAWIVAAQGDRVSDARRVDQAAHAEIEAELVDGGYLVLDVPTKLPEEFGDVALDVRRKDGVPLLSNGDLWKKELAATGARLGPLPPGDYVFVVRLAGIDVAEVAATVRAGATETLRLPVLPRR